MGKGITGSVYRDGTPLNIPDTRQFEGYRAAWPARIVSEMAVPLKRGDSVVGVLDVERGDDRTPFPTMNSIFSRFSPVRRQSPSRMRDCFPTSRTAYSSYKPSRKSCSD